MKVSVKELEEFVVAKQPDLEIIKRELSAFNIFNVLGIQHREIRHSNFLGWLFDPNESHQLGDVFLKKLFKLLREVNVFNADDYINLLLQDLSDTQVYRESVHNIDILIVNEKLGLVICIENKIYANFSDHQLEKYYTYVEKNYSALHNKVYLTLTPFNNNNHLNYKAGDNYTNITYKNIVTLLSESKEHIDSAIPTVKESINQYIAMVEKNVTYSSKEVKLAQKIYKKYKNELEFIMDNRPDFLTQKQPIFHSIQKGKLGEFEIIKNDHHKEIIRILPKNEALQQLFRDKAFNSWGGEYLFCLELLIQKEHIWLKWCFGDIRTKDAKVKAVCQEKKARMVNAMKDFDCFKTSGLKIDRHSANPDKPFAGICGVTLFFYDDYLNQDASFLDFLKEKFSTINTKLIEPWTAECIQKLSN